MPQLVCTLAKRSGVAANKFCNKEIFNLASYLSKLAGLGLLTRRLCSCLIGSQPSNITTIIF